MSWRGRGACLGVFLWVISNSYVGQAHVRLLTPAAREDALKKGPCGSTGSQANESIRRLNVFAPGQTITLIVEEYIEHPGHYCVSFDPDGYDDFDDPADENACPVDPDLLIKEKYPDTNQWIMCPGPNGQQKCYSFEITLPNIECERCTLQVIQMMTDKPPYGDGNDLYYQCADVALRAGGAPDAGAVGSSADAATQMGENDARVVSGNDAGIPAEAGRTSRDINTNGCMVSSAGESLGSNLASALLFLWSIWAAFVRHRRRQRS